MSAQQDADALKKAMKGFGTDEAAIIKIVANRKNSERQKIKEAYKQSYGSDLIKDLKSELRGKLEDAIVALFESPIEYDCSELKNAMKGMGTDEGTLIEIITSRDNKTLKKIKETYKNMYGKDLESAVKGEVSGDLEKILVSLLQCKRSDNKRPNAKECAQKAKELYEAGEKKFGTDESVFNKIFALSSPAELTEISKEYDKLAGHTILKGIEKEFSGKMKTALYSIVYATISPSEYFATRIRDAMKGAGTNEKLLTRILVTRDEIDMPQIKQYYKQLYGKDMIEDVKKECSGDYEKLLVELAGH